jgi:hypothetical protein
MMIIVCVSKEFLFLFFLLLIMVDDWVQYSIKWRARESVDRLRWNCAASFFGSKLDVSCLQSFFCVLGSSLSVANKVSFRGFFFFFFFFLFYGVALAYILAIFYKRNEWAKKIGYRLKRKVENLKNRAIFLRLTYLLAGTYCINMAISKK